jgi:uncharacterized protein (TIGR03089 family)
MSELISGRLRRWVAERGASPLVTYYDLANGERTELSGVSMANWVDKTSNLLVDELDVEPGDQVELAVAERHSGHWVSLVWPLACWQVGAAVTLGRRATATVVVVGPDDSTAAGPEASVLICSLHPLGLPLTQPPGGGVLDFILEVRAQPDQHAAVPQSGLVLAWRDATRQLTQADLLSEVPTDRRRLVRPSDPWSTIREGLLAPLLGGGSSVVVTGPATPDQLASIAGQEQADLPAGP